MMTILGAVASFKKYHLSSTAQHGTTDVSASRAVALLEALSLAW